MHRCIAGSDADWIENARKVLRFFILRYFMWKLARNSGHSLVEQRIFVRHYGGKYSEHCEHKHLVKSLARPITLDFPVQIWSSLKSWWFNSSSCRLHHPYTSIRLYFFMYLYLDKVYLMPRKTQKPISVYAPTRMPISISMHTKHIKYSISLVHI